MQRLRASGEHSGENLNLQTVTGGAAEGDSGVPHGDLLIEFAEAVIGENDERLRRARAAVVAAMGEAALVDAAAVAANFNAIDRIADATGTPLDKQTAAETEELRQRLGIDDFGKISATHDAKD